MTMSPMDFVTQVLADAVTDPIVAKLLRDTTGPLDVFVDPSHQDHESAVAWLAYRYCHHCAKDRVPDLEPIVLLNPLAIYSYATYCTKARWPEGEAALLASENRAAAQAIHDYAVQVVRQPWPKGEKKLRDMDGGYWVDKYVTWKHRHGSKLDWTDI